ncbi:MAG: DUF2065 family protein [Phycisphaerales bacterium]|nr:DUF2065 family protein [Phycisphaerales bacterium]
MIGLAIALCWFFGALCVAGTVYWSIVAWRVRRDGNNRPSLTEGLTGSLDHWPAVSVIIPAHNEVAHAPDLLRSLLAQDYAGAIEIIFVLDRCTDGTLAALEQVASMRAAVDARLTVQFIDNRACPQDWAGKCNAAHQGAVRATGDILLFTDADTTFEPGVIRASVKLLILRKLSLLSVLSTVSVRHAFEAIVQPVAALQLMKIYPIARVNAQINPMPFANGQFMMFSREAYDHVGGHAAVKDALLEDLAFARLIVHACKRKAGLFLSDGLVRVQMYETYAQFREGWRRIFIEACHRNPRRLRRYGLECMLLGTGVAIAAVASLAGGALAWSLDDRPLAIAGVACGVVVLVVAQLTLRRIFELVGVPPVAALAYPYASLAIARIMWRGAKDLRRGAPVRWGGRAYVLEPTDS